MSSPFSDLDNRSPQLQAHVIPAEALPAFLRRISLEPCCSLQILNNTLLERIGCFFFSINPVDCFKNRASPLHNSSLFGCATSIRGNVKRQTLRCQRCKAPDFEHPGSNIEGEEGSTWSVGGWGMVGWISFGGVELTTWGFPPLFWLN